MVSLDDHYSPDTDKTVQNEQAPADESLDHMKEATGLSDTRRHGQLSLRSLLKVYDIEIVSQDIKFQGQ